MNNVISLKGFLLVVFLLNLLQGIFTPIIDDEAYYWMWSQRFSFGYFDHPPMIAILIKLSDFLLNNEIGARFLTVLFNTIAAYFYWQILEPKTKKEQLIFLLLYFSIPLIQVFSFVSTPDAPLLFFTILYLYVLKKYLINKKFSWSILLGVCFAGIMYSKYHGVLVLLFTLLPIFNKLYKTPNFYFAIFLSLILYSPHFWWLVANDFPPIAYHFVDRSAEEVYSISHTLIYIGTALIAFSGLLFIYIPGAIKSRNRQNLFEISVFWLVIGPFLFFLISTLKDTTQAQWLLISYVGLGILVYNYLIKLEQLKLFYILSGITAGLLIIARVVIMIPIISPLYRTKDFGTKLSTLVKTDIVAFERYQEASIFEFYNQDKQGVVYRTLGNRNSQFTVWDDESLLNQPFTFVSPWLDSPVYFTALKGRSYFVNYVEGYQPMHHSKANFITIDNTEILDNYLEIKKNNSHQLIIEISDINIDLIKNKDYRIAIYITKDKQYNIVEEFQIPIESLMIPNSNEQIYQFTININTNLTQGDYVAYIGVTPKQVMTKFQSNPLKIKVIE